jgi:hypothetical protein
MQNYNEKRISVTLVDDSSAKMPFFINLFTPLPFTGTEQANNKIRNPVEDCLNRIS